MDLQNIKIRRCIQQQNQSLVILSLHTFTDASKIAYGVVTYAKCQHKNGKVSINLIAAKSRVAPLSAFSIPRLELLGAVLGMRLSYSIAATYTIVVKEVTFWIDSMNVIWWIHSQSRKFKPFVANRIG
ncbi:uncharacterized protein LOC136094524 [Hydra vulgaris]|uniref:uncharacterized protein LOC136094524 n=1 Tax=Hydra vulgaris TaxID=6087 RepID=UPI0032EA3E50